MLSAMKFKQIKPADILGETSRAYCDLILIKTELLSGKNERDIASKLKLHEYKVKLYARAAQGMEIERLRELIKLCCETVAVMKSSSDKGYLPLEKLICSI